MGTPEIEDLKKPWKTRARKDHLVTGAIELAYLRGYQAGRDAGLAEAARSAARWESPLKPGTAARLLGQREARAAIAARVHALRGLK